MFPPPRPIEERLAERSKRDPVSGCVLWTGYLQADGYGQIRHDGQTLAHRVAWIAERGPIPDGLVLDHLCRTRRCINPNHLEVVTDRENILRGVGPSAVSAVRDSCAKGHPYTAENTYRHRGERICRACNLASAKRYAAKRRSSP